LAILEVLLVAAGIIAVASFAWWTIDGYYHQMQYQQVMNEVMATPGEMTPGEMTPRQVYESTASASEALDLGGLFGRLRCPRIGLDVAVLNGLDKKTLRRAAGRLPRDGANTVIASHRDTYFLPLKDVREGDEIALEKLDGGTALYKVQSIEIVDPRVVDSMNQTKNEVLTLITCYPFNWIGPAPQRFVVRAEAM
jgi:sortase A